MNKKKEEIKKENELAIFDNDAFKVLSNYEQQFIYYYNNRPNIIEAMRETRKACGMTIAKDELLMAEGQAMLTKRDVSKFIGELKKVKTEQIQNLVATTGIDLTNAWSKLSLDDKNMLRLNSQIEQYDEWMDERLKLGDYNNYMLFQDKQLALIKTRDKLEESMRKNLQLVGELSGAGKEKAVMKVGSLNINLGNQTIQKGTKTSEYLEVIENTPEEDIINIDDL